MLRMEIYNKQSATIVTFSIHTVAFPKVLPNAKPLGKRAIAVCPAVRSLMGLLVNPDPGPVEMRSNVSTTVMAEEMKDVGGWTHPSKQHT